LITQLAINLAATDLVPAIRVVSRSLKRNIIGIAAP
jgi:hypothetical protein